MQVEIKSKRWANPIIAMPGFDLDGKSSNVTMVFRPEFRDGQLVALWFDDVQYGTQVHRRGDESAMSMVCRQPYPRAGGKDPYAGTINLEEERVWHEAWPFPPGEALNEVQAAVKAAADAPAESA